MKVLRLFLSLAVLAILWIKLLPQWARTPSMQRALQRHEIQGINGGAIYYTENPAALSGLQSIQELRKDSPRLFWSWSRK